MLLDLIGWMGREYYENSIVTNRLSDHPEMIDDNGNPTSDLYSVRFVVDDDDED